MTNRVSRYHGTAIVNSIRAGVDELLGRLPEFRAAVQRIDNRAVFELADILAGLLDAAAKPHPDQALVFAPAGAGA